MKKLFEKEKGKQGFTLAELLIVVAIIAVLVAVSIPVFTSRLEKSKESTDLANMRAAYAAATTGYLTDETVGTKKLGTAQATDPETVYYDAATGKLKDSAPTVGYGKGTSTDGGTESTTIGGKEYTASGDAGNVADKVIQCSVKKDGTVTLEWVAKGS